MRDRVRSLKRVLEVQTHLHSIEEIKYTRLKNLIQRCTDEQRDLSEALSGEDALHGLFMDMTVRRLQKLRQDERRLQPLLEAQARILVQHGGRKRNSERLAEQLQVELRRADERDELEQLLEAGLASNTASSKQDR